MEIYKKDGWNLCDYSERVWFVWYADIDECGQGSPCDSNATCANNAGSFTCTCNSGYSGNGRTCTGKWRECYYMFKHYYIEESV